MTEDEMKRAWCPHIRAMSINSGIATSGNMVFDPQTTKLEWQGFSCIGRSCSQWRWDDVPNPAYAEQDEWLEEQRRHLVNVKPVSGAAMTTRTKVEIIARLMAMTGKGEPFEYWLREAGALLTSLDQRVADRQRRKP